MIINKQLMTFLKIQKNKPTKKRKILIVFDDIIADMQTNKILSPRTTELFSRGRIISKYLKL